MKTDFGQTSIDQRTPRRLADLGVRRHDAQNGALVQHCGDLAGLDGHEIAADSVDDRLEDDETVEMVNGLIEHQTAHSINIYRIK